MWSKLFLLKYIRKYVDLLVENMLMLMELYKLSVNGTLIGDT